MAKKKTGTKARRHEGTERRKDGVQLIADERFRQDEKGYTAAHDDHLIRGELTEAAEGILSDLIGGRHRERSTQRTAAHVLRKWGNNPIRRLAIAGALIAAEIDRLRRAGVK